MENKNIQPMSLERSDKLKVFSIISVLKEVPIESVKDKLSLTLAVTYTPAEALMSAGQAIRNLGKDPANYNLDFMRLAIDAEEFIKIFALPTLSPPAPVKVEPTKPTKSVEETMIDNTRIIFNLVGTTAQKKSAEKVIAKFRTYTQENLQKKQGE